MSKISTNYDALISSITTLFPSKTRIPNPYDLESIPSILGVDAWGLKVGNGSPETTETCRYSIDREFTVVLVRKFTRMETKTDAFDTISKNLLEDINSLANLLLGPNEFGGSDIDRVDLSGTNGVQSFNGNDETFLFTEISINILISELYT